MTAPHDAAGLVDLLAWADARLGEASAAALEGGAGERALARVRQGVPVEDAVLKEIHAVIGSDRIVASEFAAYVIQDMKTLGKVSMSSSSQLRRFMETQDLINSVLKDVWRDVASLRFESAAQFKQLFAQRMNWKAIDQLRRLNNQSRAEDKRVPEQPEELDAEAVNEDASAHAIRQEERDQLFLILTRLTPRDQQLIRLARQGRGHEAAAQELGISSEAARKAMERAVARARKLASEGLDRPQQD